MSKAASLCQPFSWSMAAMLRHSSVVVGARPRAILAMLAPASHDNYEKINLHTAAAPAVRAAFKT